MHRIRNLGDMSNARSQVYASVRIHEYKKREKRGRVYVKEIS